MVEDSSVSFIGFHLTKTHVEGGNYDADKLSFSNYLHIAVIFFFNILMDNEVGTSCVKKASLSLA